MWTGTIPVMTYKSCRPHNISAEITNNFCRAWARRKWEMLALIIHSVVNTFHRGVGWWTTGGFPPPDPVILIHLARRRRTSPRDRFARSFADSTRARAIDEIIDIKYRPCTRQWTRFRGNSHETTPTRYRQQRDADFQLPSKSVDDTPQVKLTDKNVAFQHWGNVRLSVEQN